MMAVTETFWGLLTTATSSEMKAELAPMLEGRPVDLRSRSPTSCKV